MSMREGKSFPLQLVINDASSFIGTGISIKVDIEDEAKKSIFYGKKIGDTIEGDLIGFAGYTFKITGGSDIAGFPHIKGIPGPSLKQIMRSGPPGYRPKKLKKEKKGGGYKIINLKGVRVKKTVRGEELSEWSRQVNLAIVNRSGKKINEMSENELVNDFILKSIAEKLGKIILKWGLYGIVFEEEGQITPMADKIQSYLDESSLSSIYFKVGVAVLQNFGKEELKKVLEPLKKVSRKRPHKLGRHIASLVYALYERAEKGESLDPESIGKELADKIVDIFKKALENKLEKPKKISLKIKGGE